MQQDQFEYRIDRNNKIKRTLLEIIIAGRGVFSLNLNQELRSEEEATITYRD